MTWPTNWTPCWSDLPTSVLHTEKVSVSREQQTEIRTVSTGSEGTLDAGKNRECGAQHFLGFKINQFVNI